MFGVRADARKGAKTLQAQLLQLIQDGAPRRECDDAILVDGADTVVRNKTNTATQSLLERLVACSGTFRADDITFSVRTMLDESAHALPGSMAALTPIHIEILADLGSATSHSLDPFPIRLADPIIVDGVEVVAAGSDGQGEVVHAKKSGGSGTPGELVLAARWIEACG